MIVYTTKHCICNRASVCAVDTENVETMKLLGDQGKSEM